MLNNELIQAMLYRNRITQFLLYGMSNLVKILGNKVKSWTMILLCIQNLCLVTTAKCHIFAIILMHTNLNAPKSTIPPLVVFSHVYDLEGQFM